MLYIVLYCFMHRHVMTCIIKYSILKKCMPIYANTCSYVNIKCFSKSWNIMKHFTILHISSHEILYSIDLLLSSANICRTPAASCSSSTSLSTIFREVSKLAGQRCSGVYSWDSCGDVPFTCANGIKVKLSCGSPSITIYKNMSLHVSTCHYRKKN